MRLSEPTTAPTWLQSLLVFALMMAATLAASSYKPTDRLSDHKAKIELDQQVPTSFADWTQDSTQMPVLPNPQVQAKLDVLYSSTLARTYRNKAGQRVMLSIAYGSDQSSEATSVHRPEFCYSAQGFKVYNHGEATVAIGNRNLQVQRLVGVLGQRREPITYWITLDETATLPGLSRKYQQLRYGLRGQIPDGLLLRVSSISGNDLEGYKLQVKFLNDLATGMAPSIVARYFGNQLEASRFE